MITTLIIIYLVSVIGAYKTIQYYSYNPKGYFYEIKPEFIDFIFMILPLINTAFVLSYWLVFHKYEKSNKFKVDWNKFFNKW